MKTLLTLILLTLTFCKFTEAAMAISEIYSISSGQSEIGTIHTTSQDYVGVRQGASSQNDLLFPVCNDLKDSTISKIMNIATLAFMNHRRVQVTTRMIAGGACICGMELTSSLE